MRKIHYLYIAFVVMALASCNKEEGNGASEINETPITIVGVISNDDTKTSYDGEGKFSWVSGDKITVQLVNSSSTYDKWTFTANASTRESTFSTSNTGYISSGWSLAKYAVYPKDLSSFDLDMSNAEEPTFTLRNHTYDYQIAGNPMQMVPLIGEKVSMVDGVATYDFNTACGILKLNFEDTPAVNALRLILHHDDYPLCGTFTLSPENTLLESNVTTSRNTTKTLEPTEDGFTTAYVALPIGTIPAGLSIKLMRESTGIVYTEVVTNTAIEIKKNTITELSVPLKAVYSSCTVSGAANAPKATFTVSTGESIMYGYATTEDGAKAAMTNEQTSSGDVNLYTGSSTSTGYYLAYRVKAADGHYYTPTRVVKYYYLTSGMVSYIVGDYSVSSLSIKETTIDPQPTSSSFTFALSDDTTKGNVRLTSFHGISANYNTIYGIYDGPAHTYWVTLPNEYTAQQPFALVDGKYYYLRNSNSANDLIFVYTSSGNCYVGAANFGLWTSDTEGGSQTCYINFNGNNNYTGVR